MCCMMSSQRSSRNSRSRSRSSARDDTSTASCPPKIDVVDTGTTQLLPTGKTPPDEASCNELFPHTEPLPQQEVNHSCVALEGSKDAAERPTSNPKTCSPCSTTSAQTSPAANVSYSDILAEVRLEDKVCVTSIPGKNRGLRALSDLPRNYICAYYPVQIVPVDPDTPASDRSYWMYGTQVYNEKGNVYRKLKGRLAPRSLRRTVYKNKPVVAHFVNEPAPGETENCHVFFSSKFVQPGDIDYYPLKTTRAVRRGEELLWYYGDEYDRDYEVGRAC